MKKSLLVFNARVALSHYIIALDAERDENVSALSVVCGFAMTSGKQGWRLHTEFLYVNHTEEDLKRFLNHLDLTYQEIDFKMTPAVVSKILLSDGTVHIYDSSFSDRYWNLWHQVDDDDTDASMREFFKDMETHYKAIGYDPTKSHVERQG